MAKRKIDFKVDEIKIQSGIPIPKHNFMNKSKFETVLKQMKVGDSFGWKTDGSKSLSGLYRQAKKMKIKLTSRQISKMPVMFRIWRVE